MARILILGAGQAQIDLIEYCKDRDYFVCACSYSRGDPGESLVDHFEQIEITDAERVARVATDLGVDVVYSIGSDIAMPTVSQVSAQLGLPRFVEPWTAKTCNSKTDLRTTFSQKSYSIPFQKLTSPKDFGSLKFPFMVKPVDSQGQRGVRLVHSEAELADHFPVAISHSRKRYLIAEEFVDGPEYSVNTYSVNDKLVFAAISDRIIWDSFPGGIIREHRLPHSIVEKHVVAQVMLMVEDVLKTLEISNGPAYFQIKVDGNHQPRLIEVTPRLDGCHMWKLIQQCYGVHLLDWTMRHLMLGEPPPLSLEERAPRGEFSLEFICQKPDTVFQTQNHPDTKVLYRKLYYRDGEIVRPLNRHMEKCGYLLRKLS